MTTPGLPEESAAAETRVRDFRVKIGGLLRCCLATLGNRVDEPAAEGTTLDCDYCKQPTLIVRDGYWRWNHE